MLLLNHLLVKRFLRRTLQNRRVMETYSEMVVNCPEMQLRLALRPSKVGGHRNDNTIPHTSTFILVALAVIT